jgi:hypothetical protein
MYDDLGFVFHGHEFYTQQQISFSFFVNIGYLIFILYICFLLTLHTAKAVGFLSG